MVQRPAVVIIPDYDGIGPYELWRANLLAQLGYAGLQFPAISPSKILASCSGVQPHLQPRLLAGVLQLLLQTSMELHRSKGQP